jgi:hypothetical protein
MSENTPSGLEERHAKLFDQEWNHHHDHAAKIGEHSGQIQGLRDAIDDLRRRIATLEVLHMQRAHDSTPRAPRSANSKADTPESNATT